MKQRFTLNLSFLIDDIMRVVIDSGTIPDSCNGLESYLDDTRILFTWNDLRDIANSPDIDKSLRKTVRELLKYYGEDEE